MSIIRTWLPEYRHVPRIVKTGWFSKGVVLVLQQRYHDKGTYWGPDDSCGLDIDRSGWADCTHMNYEPTLENK